MTQRPFVLGGLMIGAGYVWSWLRRVERPVPREMVEFCRREQMQRLRAFLRGRTLRRRPTGSRTLDTRRSLPQRAR
jgi:hypothetical protein